VDRRPELTEAWPPVALMLKGANQGVEDGETGPGESSFGDIFFTDLNLMRTKAEITLGLPLVDQHKISMRGRGHLLLMVTTFSGR
jgi:hypothetical protein